MFRAIVTHGPTVFLSVFCIIIFGMLSYATLPREAAPDIKIPVVMVSVPYIGVSPADVESIVTIPMENELTGIKDLKKMTSTSAEGVSIIALEFEPDAVIEDALQKVRDRVNRVKPTLPEDIEEPNVAEISFSDFPIIIVNLAGPTDSERLKALAESLEEDIGRIPGVLNTNISGGMERQIRVQLDPRRLAMYGFSMSDVSNAIADENVNIPGGNVRAGADNFLLRVPGEFTSPEEIEAVAVKRKGDRPVFVRDLGKVVDGFADVSSYARMNQESSVSIAVTKRSGANIIDINDAVKRLAAEHAETWPEGVEYRALADQSQFIRDMVSDLENNIITALLLVVAVILFFMGVRNSLFVAVSIPLSMLMSFMVLDLFGITLNMIVLFSLILALGMLVDNAIVIVENIYRHAEEGLSLKEASIEGSREVAMAVAASTATTVAAFFPLVFWTGIMGEFMGYLPKTVIIVLICSLVVAVGILPVFTARFMKVSKTRKVDIVESKNPAMRGYKALLEFSIRYRYLSAFAGFATLFATFVIYGFLNHGTEFFPTTEPPRATIGVRLPDGSDLQTTDEVIRRVEGALADNDNVDIFVAESGVAGGGSPMEGSQAQANQGRITVDFMPDPNTVEKGEAARVESTFLTIEKLRLVLSTIPGAEISVEKEEMGPPVGAPIAVEVSGPDFHSVGELASKVKRELAKIPGVTELSDDYRIGRPEMRLTVDRGAAKRTGASTSGVANAVRTAVAGSKASTFRDGKDEHDIVVELGPEYREDLQSILSLRFAGREDTSPDTYQVPLAAVASYELAGGSGSIRHIDQDLVVTIEGDVLESDPTTGEVYNANAVRAEVQKKLAELNADGELVPEGYQLRLGGADDEQRAASAFLGRAFGIAVFLISFVLVTQFNGLRLPIIILTTVLLSLIGVLWGLLLTGTPFGIIMTGLGVISLAGVVVNNAIVLLDYVEQLRSRGHDVHDALVRAGMTRFRPVMLTAITTILGLVPMALGISYDFRNLKLLLGSQSSQFWQSMAVAVIFGLGFATILTLVLVPTMYSIFEDFDRFTRWVRERIPDVPGLRWLSLATAAAASLLVGPVALGGALLWSPGAEAAPITLQDAWQAAEENNIALALSREQTIQQQARVMEAWALVSPKLSAQGTYTINQYETALDFDTSQFFDGETFASEFNAALEPLYEEFGLEYDPIDLSGGSEGGEEAAPIIVQEKSYAAANISLVQPIFSAPAIPLMSGAKRNRDAARLDEDWTRQQIRAGVTQAYYGLLLATMGQDLSERSLASARNHLELASREVAAGRLPARARLQAELSVAQAERELASAAEQVVGAQQAFRQLTGLPAGQELVVPPPLAAPRDLDEAVEQALRERPDIKAADTRVKVAQLGLDSKKLEWLPRLDGRFTWSWSENQGFAPRRDTWMIVLEANWTLWDGGARIAQTRQNSSQLRMAQLQARQARWDAEEQVQTAWERYIRATAAHSATGRELELAQENLRLAETSLQAGSSTWLEVEDARMALSAAEMARLSEQANRDLAAMELKRATGQLGS